MKVIKLCALLSIAAAWSSQAQVTVSYSNFNFRGGTGNGGFGIFGTSSDGSVVTQDGNPYPTGQYTPVTDFQFRWDGLTLDTAGTGDDHIDFTLRITSNGAAAGNVQLGGEGIGVAGGVGTRIDEDDPATTDVDESESLLIEVVDVSVSEGTLGTVTFDGFTAAAAFAAAAGGGAPGLQFDVEADVNGTTGSLSRSGAGYLFGQLAPAWGGAASPSVTVDNPVYNALGQDTATGMRIFFRQSSFSFTFTEAAGAPSIFEFSLAEGGFGTFNETQGSYFTSGTPENEADGVYDQDSLQFFFDLENATEATLKRDGVVEQTLSNPTTGLITPATQPAGVYEYTLEVTNGTDTAVSQPITVYIEQPMVVSEFSTRSNAGQIGVGGKLPLFISAEGDFDFNDVTNGLFLSFTDQAETLTEAGAGGSNGDGELTLDYRNNTLFFSENLALTSQTGRLDVPVASIVAALEAANSPLTFPFDARAKLSAVNPAGTTTVDIDFTILDSQIVVELDAETFVVDSGVLENQYISPFVQALEVANGDVVDIAGNGSVTFNSGLGGVITLAESFQGFTSFQEGYRFQDVTHSLWIDVPETPEGGGLIIKWGNDAVGTSIGIDSGNLTAITVNNANASQVSAPIDAGWHHIAVTIDIGGTEPNSVIALYLDGILVDTGDSPAEVLTSWASSLTGALYSNIGGGGYAGQSAGLFDGGGFSNATSGVIRMYNGILDAATIEALAAEFIDNSAPIAIDSIEFNGSDLDIVASGLVVDTEYYLVQDTDLAGDFSTLIDTVIATSAVETFTDVDPTAVDPKSFYRVTSVPPVE
ncbi:hypothetical protein AAFN60_14905 [Roseibacillus persicicus]|uniref:hypothetical protein n=1 Tax=Roseibacillus persicicus TaxID=454148 RepID=UPI00398A5515